MSSLASLFRLAILATGFFVVEAIPFEQYLSAKVGRTKVDATPDPMGNPGVAAQRKTQSPMIWLKYTKTELPEPGAEWFNAPFKDFAKQAVGSLSAKAQTNAGANSGAAQLLEKSSGVAGQASPSETAATLLMDAEMTMDHLSSLKNDIMKLSARVSAGGKKAKKALARLIDLWSQPNSKIFMIYSGLLFKCKKLMRSPETPDEVRALAGSLITLLTDVPVTSENSHEGSGSYGHVNVVVPRPSRIYRADRAILELEGGAAPVDTEDGAYLR